MNKRNPLRQNNGYGQINYSRVLQILREDGAASRADLARHSGLSAAAITGITRDLLAKGYVRTNGSYGTKRGRPVELLEYDAKAGYAFGLELHDHAVFGVVTDLYGKPLRSHRVEPVLDGIEAVVGAVEQWVREVSATVNLNQLVAIGLALPGSVDQNTGFILSSTEFNLPQVSITDLLTAKLPCEPVVTNRTYAAALAEKWLGTASEARNLIYIRIGDYLGGALLIDGRPYWGSGFSAGSIAHMTVDRDGLACRCGSHGCLDTVASGRAMTRRAREEIKKGRTSSLIQRTSENLELVNATLVIEEAKAGDQVSRDVLNEAAEWLGIAAATCINLLNPDLIVLGANLGRLAGKDLIDPMCESARARAYSKPMSTVQIVTSELPDDAVACGAAATALHSNLTQSINLHAA